jgi:hypothetical protein
MREVFNEERAGKHASDKDTLNIIHDPTILARVELGKTICMLHYIFSRIFIFILGFRLQRTGDECRKIHQKACFFHSHSTFPAPLPLVRFECLQLGGFLKRPNAPELQ